jgi:site-specific recombinase XerD
VNEWTLEPSRYLSKDELGKLLRRAEELRQLGASKNRKQPIRDWLIINLAIYSGLRVSELAALQVADCFIGYGRADLVVRRGKGGKPRTVRIGDHLKQCLRWYIRWKAQQGELHPESYLLRSQRSEKMTRGAVWYRWKAHSPAHRAHDARHSFGTLLLEASGGNLRVVQKALGHARITTTTVYADVVDSQVRESMQAMDRLARAAMKPKRNPQPGRLVVADMDEAAHGCELPAV